MSRFRHVHFEYQDKALDRVSSASSFSYATDRAHTGSVSGRCDASQQVITPANSGASQTFGGRERALISARLYFTALPSSTVTIGRIHGLGNGLANLWTPDFDILWNSGTNQFESQGTKFHATNAVAYDVAYLDLRSDGSLGIRSGFAGDLIAETGAGAISIGAWNRVLWEVSMPYTAEGGAINGIFKVTTFNHDDPGTAGYVKSTSSMLAVTQILGMPSSLTSQLFGLAYDEAEADAGHTGRAWFYRSTDWFWNSLREGGTVELGMASGGVSMWVDDLIIRDPLGEDAGDTTFPGYVDQHWYVHRHRLMLPTGITTNSGWTGNSGGAASVEAVNNTPPIGVADGTPGTDLNQIRSGAVGSLIDLTTDAFSASIPADEVITGIALIVAHAHTGMIAFSAEPQGMLTPPYNRATTSGSAPGTYPTNWRIHRLSIAEVGTDAWAYGEFEQVAVARDYPVLIEVSHLAEGGSVADVALLAIEVTTLPAHTAVIDATPQIITPTTIPSGAVTNDPVSIAAGPPRPNLIPLTPYYPPDVDAEYGQGYLQEHAEHYEVVGYIRAVIYYDAVVLDLRRLSPLIVTSVDVNGLDERGVPIVFRVDDNRYLRNLSNALPPQSAPPGWSASDPWPVDRRLQAGDQWIRFTGLLPKA
jgi:hypothetical protein